MFDDERAMVRIDMSEYGSATAVSRLIGAPPGYVGYEEGGQLTEAVRRRPYSVILLDEIEKAHRDVFNVLLQVLDDGRLTDGQGRTVDFRNTVLIMTSNVGSDVIVAATEASRAPARAGSRSVLRDDVPARVPEPDRRDDHLPPARPGGAAPDRRPAARPPGATASPSGADRARGHRGGPRRCSPSEGYDPAYGARPLKRAIQRLVENPLALRMLEGGAKDGDTVDRRRRRRRDRRPHRARRACCRVATAAVRQPDRR